MVSHALTAEDAFAMLREHSQLAGRKLVDVAQGVVDSHLLLRSAGPLAVPEEAS